jgi:hypothetical protein
MKNKQKEWHPATKPLIFSKKLCEETKKISKLTKNENVIAAFAEFISKLF